MHVRTLLHSSMFSIRILDQPAERADVYPNWTETDRLGVVIDAPFGAIGATHLMQLAMTAFYDAKPARRDTLPVYPEIYAFHMGRSHGTFAPYDIWPSRREIVIKSHHHRDLLDALNDRGITRLAIPELPIGNPDYRPKEYEAALDLLRSCFVYNVHGVVKGADLKIKGTDSRTEHNVNQALKTVAEREDLQHRLGGISHLKEADMAYPLWLTSRDADVDAATRLRLRVRRDALRENGCVEEAYRRIDPARALLALASFS